MLVAERVFVHFCGSRSLDGNEKLLIVRRVRFRTSCISSIFISVPKHSSILFLI